MIDLREINKRQRFSKLGKRLHELVVQAIKTSSSTIEDSQSVNTNFNQSLRIMTQGPIKITDEESAKQRIMQWVVQRDNSKKIEITTKAYKLFHRMALVYIYKDLRTLAEEKYPNSEKKQRQFERDIVCAQLGIHIRTERRQKTSAMRIQHLINAGITFDQLVGASLNVSHFEISNFYYNIFLTDVKIDLIKILLQESINPSPLLVQEDLDLDENSESESESDESNDESS